MDSLPRGTRQSTDGSEVEHPAEPGWAVLVQSVLCPPDGLVLQIMFLPSLAFASGLIYRYLSAHGCQGTKHMGLEYQGMAVRDKERGCVD